MAFLHQEDFLDNNCKSTGSNSSLLILILDIFQIPIFSGSFSVCIKPNIGELLKPVTMSKELFIERQLKLCGMTEHTAVIKNCALNFTDRIHENTNLGPCNNSDEDIFR